MLCERCQKNIARLRVTLNTKDGPRTANLCPACALTLPVFYTPARDAVRKDRECPICGMRLSQLAATGKLGCSRCYETFALELADVLVRVQGTDHHIKRDEMPDQKAVLTDAAREILQLKEALKEAVSQEDYLRAAALRDQIREKEAADELV